MSSLFRPLLLTTVLAAFSLAGCAGKPAPVSDYRIRMVPTADGRGYVALPPECPSWTTVNNNPFENPPEPQYGCAQARNLAAQVARPADLLEGKELGPPDGVFTTGSIRAYREGTTKSLIDAKSDAPVTDTTTGAGTKQQN